jgi:hypothetical protein
MGNLCMGLFLWFFRATPRLDIADNGLAALMHMDMLDGYFLCRKIFDDQPVRSGVSRNALEGGNAAGFTLFNPSTACASVSVAGVLKPRPVLRSHVVFSHVAIVLCVARSWFRCRTADRAAPVVLSPYQVRKLVCEFPHASSRSMIRAG